MNLELPQGSRQGPQLLLPLTQPGCPSFSSSKPEQPLLCIGELEFNLGKMYLQCCFISEGLLEGAQGRLTGTETAGATCGAQGREEIGIIPSNVSWGREGICDGGSP